MKVLCKRNIALFEKGKYYSAEIHSVVVDNDYIVIKTKNEQSLYRFSLLKSPAFIEDYIGWNENYFYDYFCTLQEERKAKLYHLQEECSLQNKNPFEFFNI